MRKEEIGLFSASMYINLCLYQHKCFILFHFFILTFWLQRCQKSQVIHEMCF